MQKRLIGNYINCFLLEVVSYYSYYWRLCHIIVVSHINSSNRFQILMLKVSRTLKFNAIVSHLFKQID
jgi:hypothetical protein